MLASYARMHKGKGTNEAVLYDVPSIAIVECEKDSAVGEKDQRMGFWMVDIMTHKILRKN